MPFGNSSNYWNRTNWHVYHIDFKATSANILNFHFNFRRNRDLYVRCGKNKCRSASNQWDRASIQSKHDLLYDHIKSNWYLLHRRNCHSNNERSWSKQHCIKNRNCRKSNHYWDGNSNNHCNHPIRSGNNAWLLT